MPASKAENRAMHKLHENLITRHGMMGPLIEAVPAFLPHWELCLDGWEGQGEQDTPNYLALNMLADQLILALERGDNTYLRAAFSVVERWLRDGDDYVQNATCVGLFEDLAEADRYTTCSVEELRAWLTPASRVWWHSING